MPNHAARFPLERRLSYAPSRGLVYVKLSNAVSDTREASYIVKGYRLSAMEFEVCCSNLCHRPYALVRPPRKADQLLPSYTVSHPASCCTSTRQSACIAAYIALDREVSPTPPPPNSITQPMGVG